MMANHNHVFGAYVTALEVKINAHVKREQVLMQLCTKACKETEEAYAIITSLESQLVQSQHDASQQKESEESKDKHMADIIQKLEECQYKANEEKLQFRLEAAQQKCNSEHKVQQIQKLESDLSELQADIHDYIVRSEDLNKESKFKIEALTSEVAMMTSEAALVQRYVDEKETQVVELQNQINNNLAQVAEEIHEEESEEFRFGFVELYTSDLEEARLKRDENENERRSHEVVATQFVELYTSDLEEARLKRDENENERRSHEVVATQVVSLECESEDSIEDNYNFSTDHWCNYVDNIIGSF